MSQKMSHDALAMIEYGDDPAVLLFGDSADALARSRRAAELAGCRISAAAPIAGAVERIDLQIAADVVLIELEEDGPELDRLLDRLQIGAAGGRFRSVVNAPPALIDIVAARTPHPDIEQLCEPSDTERVMAVVRAATASMPWLNDARKGARARVRDTGAGDGPPRLQELSEEVGRIARALGTLAAQEEGDAVRRTAGRKSDLPEIDAAYVRGLIQARRLRGKRLGADLFADPAWDMLLDLLAARLEGEQVAVTSLCIAAAVPATTALRWIKMLTARGYLTRVADPQDGRRVFIELSDEAAERLRAYLAEARRVSPLAP